MTREPQSGEAYQPLQMIQDPQPKVAEKAFSFPWDDCKNERKSQIAWGIGERCHL